MHTVQLSSHTGFDGWRGQRFAADHLTDLADGLHLSGLLGGCDALLSGYLGDAGLGAAVLDILGRLRAIRPDAFYCCDPVMGDDGRGLFVGPDLPAFFAARAIPAADLATPNRFELAQLTGLPAHGLDECLAAAAVLRAAGPRLVAVTSLGEPALPAGRIGSLLTTADGAWLVDTPKLAFRRSPAGAGDLFTAHLLGSLLSGLAPPTALERAVNAVFRVLELTVDGDEIALVGAQAALADPPAIYRAEAVSG